MAKKGGGYKLKKDANEPDVFAILTTDHLNNLYNKSRIVYRRGRAFLSSS